MARVWVPGELVRELTAKEQAAGKLRGPIRVRDLATRKSVELPESAGRVAPFEMPEDYDPQVSPAIRGELVGDPAPVGGTVVVRFANGVEVETKVLVARQIEGARVPGAKPAGVAP